VVANGQWHTSFVGGPVTLPDRPVGCCSMRALSYAGAVGLDTAVSQPSHSAAERSLPSSSTRSLTNALLSK